MTARSHPGFPVMPEKNETRSDFYVTHATKGNRFWRSDGTPHYFLTREHAEAALASCADQDGYYVAEYTDGR